MSAYKLFVMSHLSRTVSYRTTLLVFWFQESITNITSAQKNVTEMYNIWPLKSCLLSFSPSDFSSLNTQTLVGVSLYLTLWFSSWSLTTHSINHTALTAHLTLSYSFFLLTLALCLLGSHIVVTTKCWRWLAVDNTLALSLALSLHAASFTA